MSHPQPPINQIRRSASYSTTSNSNRPPPKTSRRQSKLNNLDRRRICEYAAAHPKSTQEDIALQWGIDRSSVSKILKYRAAASLSLRPRLYGAARKKLSATCPRRWDSGMEHSRHLTADQGWPFSRSLHHPRSSYSSQASASPTSSDQRNPQYQQQRSRHGSPIANGDRMALTNITPTKRSKLGVHDENYHSDAMDPLNDEVGEDHDNDEDDEDEVGAEEEDEEDDDDEDEDEEEEEEEEEEEDDDDEEDENDEEDDVGLEDDGDLPSRRTCESQSPERGREILKKAIFEDEDVDEEDGDRTQGFIPRPSCSNKDHSSDSARVNDSSPRFENQRSVFHLNSSTPTPPLSNEGSG
ncbi:hypothetical protein PPACK8108_LOCUS18376 [Phakopsora pachyrhizi]|uniref:HTH psq-type domain-containing protein n=1 Tax=Phakopsora pachyrhizi TaxID=170000 RepID=A0AAV0B7U1_PHAPC|nr:hypothetical protein PPACK8108_LOCUS14840 [Phakopsora pachyrhizi]CAH7684284.1 hypothetical protein PPACK8108_LOCUS18376 [Phakopsora pachyrhizi]